MKFLRHLLFASVFFCTLAPATELKPANDNSLIVSRCALALMEIPLSPPDSSDRFYDSGKAKAYKILEEGFQFARRHGDSGRQASDAQFQLMMSFPKIAISASGNAAILKADTKSVFIEILSGKNEQEISNISVPIQNAGTELIRISPDASHISLFDQSQTLHIVSTHDGQVVFKREGARETMVTYYASGFVLEREGKVEIFEYAQPQARLISAYNLGASNWQEAQPGDKPSIALPEGVLSRVVYVPTLQSLVATYLGAEPLLLKLGKNGQFNRLFLEEPTTLFDPSKIATYKGKGDANVVAQGNALHQQLETPHYVSPSFVSSKGDRLVAVRTQGGSDNHINMIDVFDLNDRSLITTVSVSDEVQSVALSPDGNFLAAAAQHYDSVRDKTYESVRIYDLRKNPVSAAIYRHKVDCYECGLLSFPSNDYVLVGSKNMSMISKVQIPGRMPSRVSYSGIDFQVPELSQIGLDFTPTKTFVSTNTLISPVVQSVGRIWNVDEFKTPRAPVQIGNVNNQTLFSQSGATRVLDMPIKFPGSNEIRVPAELAQFQEAIQKILDFEFSINPDFKSVYAYLTVDQKFVEAGDTHRNSGPHVDGIQGRAYPQKLSIDHSYLISDMDPTIFFTNIFDLSAFDVNTDNFNKVFKKQANYSTAVRPAPFEIAMMDAFTVHESPSMSQGGLRTLLRLEFSEKIFDRLGNTHNPLFEYHWEMVPKPVPEDLL